MNKVFELKKELREVADPKKAGNLQRFFKTGKGEYGEGDVFLGITVPQLRKLAKKYYSLDIKQLKMLIVSKFHEERMIALFILINKYRTTNHKKIIFHFYLKNTKYINNWDLVDLSAPNIVGEHLLNYARQPRVSDDARLHFLKKQPLSPVSLSKIRHPSDTQPNFSSSESGLPRIDNILLKLAKSENIWERRIAVLSTFQFIQHLLKTRNRTHELNTSQKKGAGFIKNNQFDDSLKIAKMLLDDKHDLIHKAVGWMLREVGKRDLKTEIKFLNKHYSKMPRTMLRYAIERFPKRLRMTYLKKN